MGNCINLIIGFLSKKRTGIVISVLIVAPSFLYAQPTVTSITPRQNEINVGILADIQAVFSEDVNQTTLNNNTWLVYGELTGYYTGQITYDAGARTGRFQPTRLLNEGEKITVSLTSGVLTSGGASLQPFQSEFTVAVEYGTGDFSEVIEIFIGQDVNNPVERDPSAILAADFNNDRFIDLAVVNSTSNSVTILENRFSSPGNSFQINNSYDVGNGPSSIAAGDFNRDGWIDLVISNFDDNSLSILQNAGNGIFNQTQTIPTLQHPTQVVVGDFDGDGSIDLASVALGVDRLQLFLNNSFGQFNDSGENYATGSSPYGLTTADLDNDGDTDIVVTNSGENTLYIFKNQGQGRLLFTSEIATPDFPTLIQANDFVGRSQNEYGDGRVDLVLIHPNFHFVSIFENRSLDGGFVLVHELDTGLRPTGLFVGDIDTSDALASSSGFGKDHDLDIVVPNIFSNDIFVYRNQFNNSFSQDTSDVFDAGETPSAITGADFDRDGDIDLAVTNLTTNSVSILLNAGGQTGGIRFTEPPEAIDFGQVYVGTDSIRNFTLFNPTGQQITVASIATTLPVFDAIPPQAVIEPGEIINFRLTFSPQDTVSYQDSLTISSDAFGINQDLVIGLLGEGVQVIIEVIPDTLNFAGIKPPQSATLPIEIFNRGNGILSISELRFTDPAFTANFTEIDIPGNSSQVVDVTFTPAGSFAYLDTLLIINNDSLNSPLPVVLLGGPNSFPPEIVSADTLFATEDILVSYTAAANDSDGTQSLFIFQNLPNWLTPSSTNSLNASVQGTPLEGDLDTTFTVIADDGIFSDTLNVVVMVTPVNDPPVFNPTPAQTITELQQLTFDVIAVDPEDSTLVLTAFNLPVGAAFADLSAGTGRFVWTAPPDSRGIYDVGFVAMEVFDDPALDDTLIVRVNVVATLPDLVAVSLIAVPAQPAIDQNFRITGRIRTELASQTTAFLVRILDNGSTVFETSTTIDLGQERAFNFNSIYNVGGDHEITFQVDAENQVPETSEDNNVLTLDLNIDEPKVVVRPNPFTPNADGFNDAAVFDFSQLELQEPRLKIFNFKGSLLSSAEGGNTSFSWDGRDQSGNAQKPGIYLYVLSDSEKRISSGYIVLAR